MSDVVPKKPKDRRPVLSRYEQDLRRAKNDDLDVTFYLATEVGDELIFTGKVLEVEPDHTKIFRSEGCLSARPSVNEERLWLTNSLVIGTVIHG